MTESSESKTKPISPPKIKWSSSCKYKLEMGDQEWVVKRIKDNHVMYVRPTVEGHENFTFFKRGDVEWLQMTGKYITFQIFVNLETGECYDNNPKDGEILEEKSLDGYYRRHYCWFKVIPNVDGTILAVPGCLWAHPHEIQFYDFSDPSKGWPRMEIKDLPEGYYLKGCELDRWMRFNGTEIFEYTHISNDGDFKYRLHLYRNENVMRGKVVEVSEAYRLRVAELDQKDKEKKDYAHQIKTTNPNYLALKEAFDMNQKDNPLIYFRWHRRPDADPNESLNQSNGCYYSLLTPPDEAPFDYSVNWKEKLYTVTCTSEQISIESLKKNFSNITECIEYIKSL